MPWVLGIDIGGTGSRATLAPLDATAGAPRTLQGERAAVTGSGSTVPDLARSVVANALATWPDAAGDIVGIGVGSTGLVTLVTDPDAMREGIADAASTDRRVPVAITGDCVTTHLGALDGESGAVVAVGTGSIALGTDFAHTWRRIDGWGHLLGDLGAGAWIGIQALQTAASAYDGRSTGGDALLDAARARFGAVESWPGQLYTRQDRAGILASFASDVSGLAKTGDDAATEIMARAGAHIADSLAAALAPGLPAVASYTGGIFGSGAAFTESFTKAFGAHRPDVELRAPAGTPVDGAVRLARMVARGELNRTPGFVWCEGADA